MKNKKLWTLLLSAAMVSTVALAGCGSSSSSSTSSTTPDKVQHMSVAIPTTDIQTLDPAKGTDAYSAWVLQETMEALGRDEMKNGKETVVPAGAQSWNTSSDGLTWTFHLRDEKWSDGQPVTADQYVYALRRADDPNIASQYQYLISGAGIENVDDVYSGKMPLDKLGVSAPDSKTLVIKLSHPCAYFQKLLNFKFFMPQREDVINNQGAKYGSTASGLVFNGPFKIVSMESGSKIELVKNEDYWDKKDVKLQQVTMNFMGDTNEQMNALQSGEIDTMAVIEKEWNDKFSKEKNLVHSNLASPQTGYLTFNFKDKNKLMSNVNIRKAIALSIDRTQYLDIAGGGIGIPANDWIPSDVQVGNQLYRDEAKSPFSQLQGDPKKLFSEGLKELGMNPDTSKITIVDTQAGTDAVAKKQGDLLSAEIEKKIGCNVKVNYEEWKQYLQDGSNLNFQMESGNFWGADYNDPMTFMDMWETDAAATTNAYSDKKYDALIDDAKHENSQAKRIADFEQAEKILLVTDVPFATTYHPSISAFTYNYVKDMQILPFAPGSELKYAYISGKASN
jgi:oligopeptide transport system substrate-binding protein